MKASTKEKDLANGRTEIQNLQFTFFYALILFL